MAEQPQSAADVAEDRRGTRRPLRPALVHRRARPAEELLDQRRRARRRLRRRHGLRRLLDHRLQPDRGVRHDRDAGSRRPSRSCPGGRRRRTRSPACSATSRCPGGEPYEGDPRWILRRAAEARRGARLRRLQRRPGARVLLLPLRRNRGRRARGARRGRLLRPDHARRRHRRAPRDDPRAGEDGHPRRVRPPRGRPLPARGRHALQGRAGDGRRLPDLPHRGQGVRDEVRLARDLHAEAAVRRERLRHARAPVADQGRARTRSSTPTTSTSSRRPPSRSSPGSSSTRARSRRSSPSG